MIKHTLSLLLLGCLALMSCDSRTMKTSVEAGKQTAEDQVARVGDKYLYKTELVGLVPKGISKKDSLDIINRYVNTWVRKQLLLNHVQTAKGFDQKTIDEKVEEYRQTLVTYELQKQYVLDKLDTAVKEEEIKKYYQDHLQNFELKRNIVKGIYLKVPSDAPRIEKLASLIKSDQLGDVKELQSYALRFATSYSLESNTWIDFDVLVKDALFASITNKVQFLKANKYAIDKDEEFTYFLRIKDYKIQDQISPLEFVREQIKSIIINKRKVILANELEDEVFSKARQGNHYDIYR